VESDNDRTVIIDASTAYRVDDEWSYGFPGTFPVAAFCDENAETRKNQTFKKKLKLLIILCVVCFSIGLPFLGGVYP
jgi:hypothetical protein